ARSSGDRSTVKYDAAVPVLAWKKSAASSWRPVGSSEAPCSASVCIVLLLPVQDVLDLGDLAGQLGSGGRQLLVCGLVHLRRLLGVAVDDPRCADQGVGGARPHVVPDGAHQLLRGGGVELLPRHRRSGADARLLVRRERGARGAGPAGP